MLDRVRVIERKSHIPRPKIKRNLEPTSGLRVSVARIARSIWVLGFGISYCVAAMYCRTISGRVRMNCWTVACISSNCVSEYGANASAYTASRIC